MKPVIFSLCLLLFLYGNLYSQTEKKELSLEAGNAYSTCNFNWSIAGNLEGQSPNILSELNFTKITYLGYYFGAIYHPFNHLKVIAYYEQHNVLRGNGSDTDYMEDNRMSPTFEKKFKSNQGNSTNLRIGLGIPIYLDNKIIITPSLFYYLTRRKFYILSDEIQDLRSIYQFVMNGAELSLEGYIRFNKILFSSLTLGYHFIKYEAMADWNLINIFQHPLSFSHVSKGAGLNANIMCGAKVSRIFSIVLSGFITTTNIKKGIDTSYFVDGNEVLTQFNGANNKIFGLRLGVRISI